MRRACNHHLAGACRWWAVCATQRDPGAQAFYQRRRDAGDGYEAALRRLAAKLIGQLHYCLTHRCHYDPARAGTSPAVTSRPPGCLSTAGHRTATVPCGHRHPGCCGLQFAGRALAQLAAGRAQRDAVMVAVGASLRGMMRRAFRSAVAGVR